MNGITDTPMALTPSKSRRSLVPRPRSLTAPRESLASALLASLGHDLRNRLTVIGAAAANLKTASLSVGDQREQADLILTELGRLNWLLQNILEMGRIDAKAMVPECGWVDASEIVTVARRQVEHTL